MSTTSSFEVDLSNQTLYINRELSQLEFNRRVLQEAVNLHHPLLERAKYLAIFSSNLDEFFMVRVSGLKQQLLLKITETPIDGLTPREQLLSINRLVTELFEKMVTLWGQIRQELESAEIKIENLDQIKPRRQQKLRDYFEREIFPVLTPLASDPSHPFPHISNLSLNLAVILRDPEKGEECFARVKVPQTLPRLISLHQVAPDELVQPVSYRLIWVEALIKANLDLLFPGMEVIDAHPFRVTRNNDMEIQEEEADDLMLTIETNLRQRYFGSVVRLEVDETMPDRVLQMLIANLEINSYDVYTSDGPLGLSCLWELMKLERPELKDTPYKARAVTALQSAENPFAVLRRQDILLQRPFDSFADIIEFLRIASQDPDVLTIKMTLYRVGSNPALINALKSARINGKQVTVLVELKARFDEESNITWARALEEAGVHVVYGVLGLKTHAKVTLIVRRERGGLRRYVHLATGNYNLTTSRIYTDLDLLSSDEELGMDATDFFNALTGYSKKRDYRKFLVAPINLRSTLLHHIEKETALGSEGYIMIKCNSLVDEQMIQAFYRASQAGVKIQLIVRGICCLRPHIKGISENIEVISIIGRFLEHSRIYYFRNNGNPALYVGSADLMPRNLDRRFEVVFPISNPTQQKEVIENILQVQWRDTRQAYQMHSDGQYTRRSLSLAEGEEPFSSQDHFMSA